jgi:AraC-like DNA-binding protein
MPFKHVPWPASVTTVDVRDPAEMDERSRVSRRLPGHNAAHCYSLRDPMLRHLSSDTLLTRMVIRSAGDLQLSHVEDRFGTAIEIIGAGMPAYCFGRVLTGRMAISVPGAGSAGKDGWAETEPGHGPIHGGRAETRLFTLDGTTRTNLWVATSRFEAALRAWLHEEMTAPLIFAPSIDWTRGPGAGLHRLVAHAEAEFVTPGGMTTNAVELAAFTDLFVHAALRALPHNYTPHLSRAETPAPVHLRRAEAYIQAHADAPMLLEEVAAAAGCSVRSLQRAFRQFRDTTPHAAIHAARLDRARAELMSGTDTLVAIGRRFGFSQTGRFARAYVRRFGSAPPNCRGRVQTWPRR